MKHLGWIGILVLLALAACHTPTREAKRMVARAERLADTLPDSTARLIDSVLRMPVYFNERQRMDMALLQAEALFGDHGKEISPVMDDDFFDDNPDAVSTSPELERAAQYYAKKKHYAKAARAALYSGFVQQHYNEKEAAMQSFKDAEYYGEIIKDSLTMAYAQYKMGKMFLEDGMKQEALDILNKANLGFGDHFADKASTLNVMAVCNMMQANYENAESCLQQSLLDAEKSHSKKIKHKALNNYSVLYRIQNKYNLALEGLRQIEKEMDSTEMPILYLNKAIVFVAMNDKDSASYYFDNLKPLLLSSNTKKLTKVSAYNALSRFAESQEDIQTALRYRENHESIISEILEQRREQSIYRIQQQYDYESLQNEMNRKLIRRQRIITIISVLAIIGLVALAVSQIRLAKARKQEAETNANLFHFMQQNKALVESNMVHERKVLDTTQQLSDLLNARLKAMQKLDYCLKTPKDKIALKDLEKEVFGDGDHWEAVKEVLVALYPGLWETLRLKYPEMDEMELRVCMLSRLKLSRLGEATLLGISTSVLDKLRTKVRKMMEQYRLQ